MNNYSSIFAATTRVPNLAVSSARRSKPVPASTTNGNYGSVIAAPAGTDPVLWSVLSTAERRQIIDGDSKNLMVFGLMKAMADLAA